MAETSTVESSARPRGREAARRALIEAAADLLAERGEVSVRTIAARAGVNHGLVHHYFGGKQGLQAAVLDHLAAEQARLLEAVDGADPIVLAQAAMRVAADDRRFFRVLARALLDGDVPAPMQSAYPVVQRMIATFEARGVEAARARVAEGIAVALGWMLFRPWIVAATGLPDADADALLDTVVATHTEGLLPPTD
ncbi:MAG: TetR/AcrR family transcriptional regulator [Myxococcota bacterium]